MKKFLKLMVALVFIAIPCLLVFSACSLNVKLVTFSYNLNGGDFTEEYRTKNNLTSKNSVKAGNLNYYGGFADGLPDERDLVAPEGEDKVFAGWYLDKECTPEKYLTSESWEEFATAVKENKGNGVLYARWIPKGSKDILYEVVSDEVSFKDEFVSKNNSSTRIIRFTISDYETQKSNLPTVSDLEYNSTNYEFAGWKVENNGHYYDFYSGSYNLTADNKNNANVNFVFDDENFADFFDEKNASVAYVLLRPKALNVKPWNDISISLDIDVAGYNGGEYVEKQEQLKTEVGNFLAIPDPKNSKMVLDNNGEVVATYYSNLEIEVRYDMSYENVSKIIPEITMLDSTKEFDGWKFKIGENEYEFNKTNWETYAMVRPDVSRDIEFILKTK